MKINNKFDPDIAAITMPRSNALSVIGESLISYDKTKRKNAMDDINLDQIRAKIADDRLLAKKVQGGKGDFQTAAGALGAYKFGQAQKKAASAGRKGVEKRAAATPRPDAAPKNDFFSSINSRYAAPAPASSAKVMPPAKTISALKGGKPVTVRIKAQS